MISGLSYERQLFVIRLQVAKMPLEVIIEFKENSVLTLLNNRRNADISKVLIFRSLSLKPANYRQFQNDLTVSFLKFSVIRKVRPAAIATSFQPFITHHRLCVRFCSVGVLTAMLIVSVGMRNTQRKLHLITAVLTMQSCKHYKYSTNYIFCS